ncbi:MULTISPECIES: YggT family protein [unclassified Pasteurella]|uniref:YggT family protein n=1 Tax=unclassified Pasteurella TaxID=2621516 RepID=UPI001074615A|nr:YggT family protein [Pasteurella sp. 19428wF3_WM03]TFU53107.1 YggT family protein [Pasteurella sp. WM03]
MELSQTALFIGSIINFYALVLILRTWLQFARVDYYNPLSQFAVKATEPILKLVRKLAPTIKNIDTSALFVIFLLGALKSVLHFGLAVDVMLILGILSIFKAIGVAIFYVLFISAISSWFNQGNNPIFYALYQLTEPLLSPIRKILPTIGMIDFSPMVIVFILLFINNLLFDLLQGIWAIAG